MGFGNYADGIPMISYARLAGRGSFYFLLTLGFWHRSLHVANAMLFLNRFRNRYNQFEGVIYIEIIVV
jgi:hypothetical protein